MDNLTRAFLFILFVVAGMILEVAAKRIYFSITGDHYRIHHFTFGKYFFAISAPLLATIFLLKRDLPTLGGVFLTFAFVGALLEWFVGWSYHRVVGERLWTYHRYPITGYTSWLTLPIWGMGGVLFWLLARAFLDV